MPTSSGEQIRVLIADDHTMVLDVLAYCLSASSGIAVSKATNLSDAIEQISSSGPYDVIILDYDMPGMHGVTGVRRVQELCRGKPVAILTGNLTERLRREFISAGVAGIIMKTSGLKRFVSAVRFMHAGEFYLPFDLMVEEIHSQPDNKALLTQSELQVLSFLAKGKRNREIAYEINTSEASVKMRVAGLFRKLGATNRTEAVIKGGELGLIS